MLFRRRPRRGFSLVEVMVAAAILCVVGLLLVKLISLVSRGFVSSRQKTSVATLIKAQVDNLSGSTYGDGMRPTTTEEAIPGISPAAFHDPANYPPQIVEQNGVLYTIFKRVDRAETAGSNFVVLPATAAETNLRRIQVWVIWQNNGRMENRTQVFYKATPAMNVYGNTVAGVEGVVTTTDSIPITSCVIMCNGFPGSVPSLTGRYKVRAVGSETSFRIYFRSPGFKVRHEQVPYDPAHPLATLNVQLERETYRSVSGVAWVSDRPVISRVVGSTVNAATGFEQEYVEVFNPTTFTWTAALLGLRHSPGTGPAQDVSIVRITTGLNPGRFYLFANTSPVRVEGVDVAADALWNTAPGNPNELFPRFLSHRSVIGASGDGPLSDIGGLELTTGTVIDRVGWAGSLSPVSFEGAPIPAAALVGMNPGEAFNRFASTSGLDNAAGPAYDTDNNSVNWARTSAVAPRSHAGPALPLIAGRPAHGGWMKAHGNPDNFVTMISSIGTGAYPYGRYTLTMVSTGPVRLYGFHGNRSALGIAYSTGDAEPVFFTGENPQSVCAVDGYIRTTAGDPVPMYSLTCAAGVTGAPFVNDMVNTDALGFFRVFSPQALMPGLSHTLGTSNMVPNKFMQVAAATWNWGIAAHTGGASHSRGTVAQLQKLAEVVVHLYDGDGGPVRQPTAWDYTYVRTPDLTSINMYYATGTHTLPASSLMDTIDNMQKGFEPANLNFTITPGDLMTTVDVGTFTMTTKWGNIAGTLTVNGKPAPPGVVIVVLPLATTLPGGAYPPAAPAFGTTAQGGKYSMRVLAGSHNVYAWYSAQTDSGFSVDRRDNAGVTVVRGSTTTVDFSW